jgi:hypothetical protein
MKLSLPPKNGTFMGFIPVEGSSYFCAGFVLDQTEGFDNVFSEHYGNVYCLEDICIALQLPHEI